MSAQTCLGMPISNRNSTSSNIVVKQRVFFILESVQLSVFHNPAKMACLGKIWFSWNRLSANQIAPFFKSQYLMNLFNRYVHIFHGGRPNWEEVIEIFHDVTCLPKHAQACPYRTKQNQHFLRYKQQLNFKNFEYNSDICQFSNFFQNFFFVSQRVDWLSEFCV